MEPKLEKTFTLQEVAAHFNVTDQTVRRWLKPSKKIISATRKPGQRKYIFTQAQIDAASPLAGKR